MHLVDLIGGELPLTNSKEVLDEAGVHPGRHLNLILI